MCSSDLKKIFHANGNQKKAGVAILISDKLDFKTKAIKKDKEGHYIMIKGSMQEDITLINIYTPNIGAPKYIKQISTDIKGEADCNTIIVGVLTTPLTSMDHFEFISVKGVRSVSRFSFHMFMSTCSITIC